MYGGRAPKGVELCNKVNVCILSRFYRPVTVLESLKRFLHIIARKKTNQQYKKNLTLHQPVLKFSKSN